MYGITYQLIVYMLVVLINMFIVGDPDTQNVR